MAPSLAPGSTLECPVHDSSYHWDKKVCLPPLSQPRFGRAWLGPGESMTFRTQIKHRFQRRGCFYAVQRLLERLAYCLQNEPSYSTLGRKLPDNSVLSRQQASVHIEALPRPTGETCSGGGN